MKSSVSQPMRNQQPSSQPQTDVDEELPADPFEGDSEYSEEEAEADRQYERSMEELRRREHEMEVEFTEAWNEAHRKMSEEYRRKIDPLIAKLREEEEEAERKLAAFEREYGKDDPFYEGYKENIEDHLNRLRKEIEDIRRQHEDMLSQQGDW